MEKTSRIFVAGHRGLVGSAIRRELERQGYTNLLLEDSRRARSDERPGRRRNSSPKNTPNMSSSPPLKLAESSPTTPIRPISSATTLRSRPM